MQIVIPGSIQTSMLLQAPWAPAPLGQCEEKGGEGDTPFALLPEQQYEFQLTVSALGSVHFYFGN